MDNCSVIYVIFHKVNISESRRNNPTNEKNVIMPLRFFAYCIILSFGLEIAKLQSSIKILMTTMRAGLSIEFLGDDCFASCEYIVLISFKRVYGN